MLRTSGVFFTGLGGDCYGASKTNMLQGKVSFFGGIIPRIVAAILNLICFFRQWVFQIPNAFSKLQSNKPGRRCKNHKKVTNITQERQVSV